MKERPPIPVQDNERLLVISRKENQAIYIGDSLVTIGTIHNRVVTLIIRTPKNIPVCREEKHTTWDSETTPKGEFQHE